MDTGEEGLRLWEAEEGNILLEIKGRGVLVLEGASGQERERLRNKIWDSQKGLIDAAAKEAFLRPSGLSAQDYYKKAESICDNYKGNTLLLYEALAYLNKAIEVNKNFVQAYARIADIMVAPLEQVEGAMVGGQFVVVNRNEGDHGHQGGWRRAGRRRWSPPLLHC